MKKLIKTSLIAVAIAACSTAVFFTACKKENTNTTTNTENTKSNLSEQDKQTELKIRAFRSQVQSNVRIAENLSTEEALWYIEAALNYTFCRGSQGILMPEVDTTEITLTETSTGVVAFAEVAEKYNTLAVLMETNAAALAQNNRQYMLVDLMDKGSNGGIISFSCMMLHGAKPDSTAGNARVTAWTAFGPDDNWYYGEKLGRIKADGQRQYVGQYDATTVLTNYINVGQGLVYPSIPHDPNDPYYFSDVTNILIDEAIITSNYIAPGQLDNIKDYYGFYRSITNSGGNPLDLVIRYAPHNEMNFYKDGLDLIKTDVDAYALTLTPPRTFKYCKVNYDINWQSGQRNIIFHTFSFQYGVKHQGIIPD